MTYNALFSSLKTVARYTVHIVEKDEVVVLYNSKRSLLLQGHDNVRLFSYISNTQATDSPKETQLDHPENLAPLVASLLQQNILEYVG